MKKSVITGIIISLILIGGIVFYFLNSNSGVFCPDYDGKEQQCLLHSECEWISEEGICNEIGTSYEDKENEEQELIQELENIAISDIFANELCKKLPLSDQTPLSGRYYCLAIVNNNEKFCEGIDEEEEGKICLALANKNYSYCKELQSQEAKHLCYFQLAVSSENIEFCKEIDYLETEDENKEEKLRCYYNFISNLYQWEKSNEIKTEYCMEFPEDYEDRITCFALKERNISLCDNIPNCLTHFEQPLSFCDENPELDGCIKDRAKTKKDVSICELLDQPDKDSCYGVYCTHISLDYNTCDEIKDIKKRQEMYIELAITLKNL